MTIIRSVKVRPSSPLAALSANDDKHEVDPYLPTAIESFVQAGDRNLPWDSLRKGTGTKVDHAMTAREVLTALDLNFEMRVEPLVTTVGGVPIDKYRALVRTNNDGAEECLGLVTDRYEATRPSQSLGFLDAIVEDHDGAHYTGAWQLRDRRMIGVTIEFPETVVVDPGGANDEVALYLLGVDSFDGSGAFQAAVMGMRVWCFNQVLPSLRTASRRYCRKHVSGIGSKLDARNALGITLAYGDALDVWANTLYQKDMTDRAFAKIVKDLFPIDRDAKPLMVERQTARRDLVHALYAESVTNANIHGTKWGAMQALYEYADWGRGVRGVTTEERAYNRAQGDLVGRTEAFKNRVNRVLATA